jgi:hypothetical protein
LSGLSAESVLSALYGFFVAAVKDTLVVRLLGAEQVVETTNRLGITISADCDKQLARTYINGSPGYYSEM